MNAPALTRNTVNYDWNAVATPKDDIGRLVLDNRTNQDIFFDVDIVPVDDVLKSPYRDDNERQAVVDVATNRIIAYHGKQYTLVKNEYAFNMVNDAINELGAKGLVNIDGLYIKDAVVSKGGKTIRQYIFPNHLIDFNGESIMMRIVVINSYDGSANFSLQVGGFRIVCTNGLVTGNRFMNLNQRHKGTVNLASIEKQIVTASKSFQEMGKQWEAMLATTITNKQIENLCAEFASMDGDKVSFTKYGLMNDLFENHAKTLGRNWWAAYNSLTAWATHYEVQERNAINKPDVVLGREAKVAKLINNQKIWMPA